MIRKTKKYLGVKPLGVDSDGRKVYEVNFQLRINGNPKRIFRRVKAVSMQEAFDKKVKLKFEEQKKYEVNPINSNVTFEQLRVWLINDLKGDNCRKKTISRSLNTFDTFFNKY